VRYYSITISNPESGKVWTPQGSPLTDVSFTNYFNGKTIPGAWHVEFDIPVATQALSMGASFVRVHGVSLKDISQASNLTGYNIEVSAGMSPGLQLASQAYQKWGHKVIARGSIYPAFGNWIDTEQTLDLCIVPPLGTSDRQLNLTLNWTAGQKLSDAIAAMLTASLPKGWSSSISISDNLVQNYDEPTFTGTLTQMNRWLLQRSQAIIKDPTYLGIYMGQAGNTVKVYDGTTINGNTQIDFIDMIGQPTWLDLRTIQIKCPIRGDLTLGNTITMPKPINGIQIPQTLGPQSFQQLRQKSDFQGTFMVQQQRHVGASRSPSADAWNTTINAVATGAA
jgi:hypothetical protein